MTLSALRRLLLRLLAHLRSTRAEAHLSKEVDAHLRLLEDDFISKGMAPGEARYAALRAFGGVAQAKERHRDARSFRMLTGWRMDLTLAVRMLRRRPALSAVAVFGIAVAMAIAATMFTIIGQQLGPSELPLPDGDRIVAFQRWDSAANKAHALTPGDVVAWREQLSTVRDIGAYRTVTKNLIVPPRARADRRRRDVSRGLLGRGRPARHGASHPAR
jgi:hypothetical protein